MPPRFLSFALSIALHGLLFLALFFLSRDQAAPVPVAAIFVDLPVAPGEADGKRGAAKAAVRARAPVPARPRAGAIQWKTKPFAWEEGGSSGSAGDEEGKGLRAGSDWGSPNATKEAVYRRVEEYLPYPFDLERVDQAGRTRISLVLSAAGKVESCSVLERDTKDIAGWAMDALEKAFAAGPFPAPGHRLTLTLDFHLRTDLPLGEAPIEGSVLHFYRTRNVPFLVQLKEGKAASKALKAGRKPPTEAGVDLLSVGRWLFLRGREKRQAKERLLLEEELREAKRKRGTAAF